MKRNAATTMVVLSALSLAWSQELSFAGPIYVIERPDGSTTFTSRPPAGGVNANVFTARSSKFSYYRGTRGRSKIFKDEFKEIIDQEARAAGLAVELIRAVIHAESGFRVHAVSRKGAQGLMQLMPSVQTHLGVRDPFLPRENIKAGVRHLRSLFDRFKGNEKLALAAYNAGPEAVKEYGGVPPFDETVQYISKVQALKERYRVALSEEKVKKK